MNKQVLLSFTGIILLLLTFGAARVLPQTTEFSYQGFLSDTSASANGIYDFEFRLYDAATSGTLIGSLSRPNVTVTNGVFSVVLDFGAFPAANRFLEIAVRPPGGSVSTTLAPRSKLLSAPYSTNAVNAQNATNSVNSQNAANATNANTAQNALQLGGTAANQFVLTGDVRLSNARNPLPGSPNYIQNSTTPQTATNFNVSGNGTAGGTLTGSIIRAETQFNIGSIAVLKSPGNFNFFAGNGAGINNTTGSGNSFFGSNAGILNTTGENNAYFGYDAGRSNNTGIDNSYFGKGAGRLNTNGSDNSFFGISAGGSNTTADGNSFFGARTGESNTTGSDNSFFGFEAGRLNSTASSNSFFGNKAGVSNVTGSVNSFFGQGTGSSNISGLKNSFFGAYAGGFTTTGSSNTFIGSNTGENTSSGDENTFIGAGSGSSNFTGSQNTALGTYASVASSNLINATAIGHRAFVAASDSLVLGSISGLNSSGRDTNVGIGTSTPRERLDVNGIIRVTTLGAAGSTTLCRNINLLQISTCSSSLRYKTNIAEFSAGLNLVNQLKPITFNWKEGGMPDLGLGAEDVAAVEPLLVTYNETGAVEGVKYDRVAVVLLNAVKEQQIQIEQQKKQLQQQQSVIEGLRKIVCPGNLQAEVCK